MHIKSDHCSKANKQHIVVGNVLLPCAGGAWMTAQRQQRFWKRKLCRGSLNVLTIFTVLTGFILPQSNSEIKQSQLSGKEIKGGNDQSHSLWNTSRSCQKCRPNTVFPADQKSLLKLTISNYGLCKNLSYYLCKWLINCFFTVTMLQSKNKYFINAAYLFFLSVGNSQD